MATSTPIPTATPTPNASPTPSPSATASPAGNIVWQVGDAWVIANTGQCGTPTFPTASSIDFILNRNDDLCMRNQFNPVGNGGSGVYRLNIGQTYTWHFTTLTHMGIDTGHLSQRLVWQIHDYITNGAICSPLSVLGISNGFDGTSVQKWYLQSGNGTKYIPYTEGAVDNWTIRAVISNGSSGHFTVTRNGVVVDDGAGPTFNTCTNNAPWWNIGPYMWDWVHHNAPSSLNSVEILFSSMVLTQP
jgi:hypothetical protein